LAYLIAISILWSFSFGIIKYGLAGIDSSFISFARNVIALTFFSSVTIYNIKKFSFDLKLVGIGALQFGLMYIFYIESYQYLPAYLIATFTITTPIYVVLASKYLNGNSLNRNGIYAILLVIIGSYLMRFNSLNLKDYMLGFVLIQCANIFFATGQILFKKWNDKNKDKDIVHNFSQLFFGATLITSIFYFLGSSESAILTQSNLFSLLFLGIISSGIGFLMWNIGATKVSAEKLAIMNNAVIPIAIFNSYLIFGEEINFILFFPGLIFFYLAFKLIS
jgi:drug/metabolite transporter (DMT)-like permease|tara:strand:+ start:487 stop:1320 length:834 start_codon:yes stop_codon:yes gene_type:complete